MSDVKTQWRFPGDELPWARELNRSKESIACPPPEFRISFSIPWDTGERPAEARLIDGDLNGLIDQVARRLARGHYKVAIRRALMHYAGGGELPKQVLRKLDRAAARCKEREIQGMWLEAVSWAQFARPWARRDAFPCPLPFAARDRQVGTK